MSSLSKHSTAASSALNDPVCPCQENDKRRRYRDCCGQYHHGTKHLQAPDAATLMRSRYSAYVLDQLDYLRQTWHPDTRPDHLEPNAPGTRWLGLKVIRHEVIDADHARVEFVARVRNPQGQASRMHEMSRFVRLKGQWFYVDGDYR